MGSDAVFVEMNFFGQFDSIKKILSLGLGKSTLQWASAKDVKCLASSSVSSGSMSSQRTAKPLQPNSWSCLRRDELVFSCKQSGLKHLRTWSLPREDLVPFVHNTACLARERFHSRKLLPEAKRWDVYCKWMALIKKSSQVLYLLTNQNKKLSTCLSAASTSSFSWSHSLGV